MHDEAEIQTAALVRADAMAAASQRLEKSIQGQAEIQRKLREPQYLQLLKDTYCVGATDAEFALAIETARHLGLDPAARQIYFIKAYDGQLRREKLVTIVGIDGLRLIAERTGLYAGQTAPQWCGPDGKWVDVWLGDGPPAACRMGVLRRDFEEPVYCVVKYKSFAVTNRDGKPRAQWAKMADHMIWKCCEAQCLRRAFPQELAGDYEVKDAEPNAESRGFRVRQDGAGLLTELAEAATPDELNRLAAQAADLPEAEREAARVAWTEARDRIASVARETKGKGNGKKKKNGKTKAKAEPASEPEVAPAGEYDYGPPPWDEVHADAPQADAEPAAQPDFGFDSKGNDK